MPWEAARFGRAAVKTSQSGYISRRMNRSMEDNVVRSGGIICTSMDDIIAPQWGRTDSIRAMERVKLVELKESEQSIVRAWDR